MLGAWSVADVAAAVGGAARGATEVAVRGVCTDSRSVRPGDLFFALRGPRFDGHAYVTAACGAGAVAAVVERPVRDCPAPQIVVADAVDALARLARAVRSRFAGTVVAVTGSAGKTTTRSLIASVLAQRWRVHVPEKNYNNHIGVPLTVFGLADTHEAAVFELGCSDFGEIAALTTIVDPDVGVVTNVGPAHLEKLGDLEGVARAKGELFAAMRADATAVRNLDDPHVRAMAVRGPQVTYAAGADAQVRLTSRRTGRTGQQVAIATPSGAVRADLALLGAHNAHNATAAAAVGWALGMSPEQIAAGLAAVRPVAGRLCPRKVGGMVVIDDAYNANPASTRAALSVLAEMEGAPKVAVLGDMLELGSEAEAAHEEVGRWAARCGVDAVIAVGRHAPDTARGAGGATSCRAVADVPAACRILSDFFVPGAVLLIKGSRGMHMEEVLAYIDAHHRGA